MKWLGFLVALIGLLALPILAQAPAAGQPAEEPPGGAEPGTSEPGTSEPGTSEPGTSEPGTSEPGTSEPGTSEPGTSEPGQVTVSLSPDETTVGGRVRAEITVVWMGEAPTEAVRFPTWQEEWGGAEIVEKSTVESFVDQSGRHVATQVLELIAFDAGDVDLPSRTFAVPLAERTVELSSQPARFVITSLLPSEEVDGADPGASAGGDQNASDQDAANQDAGQGAAQGDELELRAAAPPAALDASPIPFLASAAALVVIFMLGLWQLRQALTLEALAEAPEAAEMDAFAALEPLEELLARLDQLDPLHGAAAHTGLSLALRRYLGRSLGFNAVESTTTEIQRQLLQKAPMRPPADLAQRSLELLRASDLVKFAGLEADAHTARARIDEAREIARGVEAHVELSRRPATPAAEAA